MQTLEGRSLLHALGWQWPWCCIQCKYGLRGRPVAAWQPLHASGCWIVRLMYLGDGLLDP